MSGERVIGYWLSVICYRLSVIREEGEIVASLVDTSNRLKSDKVYDKARDKVTIFPM